MGEITGYHAHVYYDAESKAAAQGIITAVEETFPDALIGRMHDAPIGPHPKGSCQIAFGPALFGEIVPWLATHRRGLTVFIHTQTGDDLIDHTDNALWMGTMETLDTSLFEDDSAGA